MAVRFALGNDDFRELREENAYYVDKTGFLREMIADLYKVRLFTRPRRFGKTLMLSMMEDFFSISRDSRTRFEGLRISEEKELCAQWQNQYPVIFLSLKSVESLDFAGAYKKFEDLLASWCKKHSFLTEAKAVHQTDRELLKKFETRTAEWIDVEYSLYTLTRILSDYYQRDVILLLDEYDVPLAKASEFGYYPQMLEFIRGMLGRVLKTNEYLKFAVLTGCLKISKESIFTGTNNFVTDTIAGEHLDEFFGFTPSDIQKLLKDTDLEEHAGKLKEWYDGYCFGSVDVYCPWDVLNYVAALKKNPAATPKNYWENTSHNGIIKTFIQREAINVQDKLETLMDGGVIEVPLLENLTYDVMKEDYESAQQDSEAAEQNFWNLLFFTGYLTNVENPDSDGGTLTLKIPNREIKSIFKTSIVDWIKKAVQTYDRRELFEAFWNGDTQKAEEIFSDILFQSISYHDYKESYYHAFVAGSFIGAGYSVESNYEYGKGRPDIVVSDRKNRRVLLLEIKCTRDERKLGEKCDEALRQIEEKKYALALKGFRSVICLGISFCEKECRIKKHN